jgi:hypothetical protein
MTPAQESRAKQLIEKQVAMSGQTLDALKRAGLTGDKEIQLDFFFAAPNEKSARVLVEHLKSNDCLNVSVERTGSFISRKWVVRGQTHPTQVTAQVLAQWLPWMVVQGITHGCEFDGWGAEV